MFPLLSPGTQAGQADLLGAISMIKLHLRSLDHAKNCARSLLVGYRRIIASQVIENHASTNLPSTFVVFPRNGGHLVQNCNPTPVMSIDALQDLPTCPRFCVVVKQSQSSTAEPKRANENAFTRTAILPNNHPQLPIVHCSTKTTFSGRLQYYLYGVWCYELGWGRVQWEV
jgi:hypothetical protein